MEKPSEQIDIIAQKEPEATAQGENVILTVLVTYADNPQRVGKIRLMLSWEQADHLASQIQPAVRTARVRSQQRS